MALSEFFTTNIIGESLKIDLFPFDNKFYYLLNEKIELLAKIQIINCKFKIESIILYPSNNFTNRNF